MNGPVTARDAFVQALADIQLTGEHTRDLVAELRKIVEPAHAPADARTIRLTATAPTNDSATKRSARSFTVVNQYAFNLAIGFGGISSTNQGAFILPPKSVVTLPIRADDVEVGAAAADLAAGDVFVFVFLHEAPQPFFFAEWAG